MITTRYLKQNLPRKHTGKTFFIQKHLLLTCIVNTMTTKIDATP